MAHVFTTYFAALPEEADAAYRFYSERIAAAPVEILAASPQAHPASDDFHLWQLRCEAAYEGIPRHGELQLFVVRALIEGGPGNATDEAATAAFYLDEPNEPGHYPTVLDVGPELPTQAIPEARALTIAEPIYLSDPDTLDDASALYAKFRTGAEPFAHDPALTPVDVVHDAEKVGPLWVRNAQAQGGGQCEECTSLHMDAWRGFVLSAASPAQLQSALAEDAAASIYARLITRPF